MKKKSGLAIVVLLLSQNVMALSLSSYLEEVSGKNEGAKAYREFYQAKGLRANEASLQFKPAFFLNGEYADDQRPTNAVAFQGNKTMRRVFRAGLSENFRSGTKATLSYNFIRTEIKGANAQFLPRSSFYDLAPQIELSQSLWRNFFGVENRATEDLQNAQVEMSKLTDQLNYKQLMIKAENTYWRLYFAELGLAVQKESLERAKRLKDINQRKVAQSLIDETNLIQAESNLQAREIEYETAEAELASARTNFNSMRQTDEEVNLVGEAGPSAPVILDTNLPSRIPMREDVMISLQNQRVLEANAQLGQERNKPNLELYGSYSLNGRSQQFSNAYDQANTKDRPFTVVGFRFSTPLDVGSVLDYSKAYSQEKVAATLNHQRKIYEVEKEWTDLSKKFEDYKKRLKLSMKLEQIEKRKLNAEKVRYGQGRTTTFQVLQFEQDFANAQLLKIRSESELVAIYNQLKLFSGVTYE